MTKEYQKISNFAVLENKFVHDSKPSLESGEESKIDWRTFESRIKTERDIRLLASSFYACIIIHNKKVIRLFDEAFPVESNSVKSDLEYYRRVRDILNKNPESLNSLEQFKGKIASSDDKDIIQFREAIQRQARQPQPMQIAEKSSLNTVNSGYSNSIDPASQQINYFKNDEDSISVHAENSHSIIPGIANQDEIIANLSFSEFQIKSDPSFEEQNNNP